MPAENERSGARRSGRALALLLVPLAALVAVVLLLLRLHLEPPTVPPYSAASPEATVTLHPGDTFVLDLRPEHALTGAVWARGFLVRDDRVLPWDAPFRVDRDGSVHVSGPVDRLFAGVPPGEWDVAVAVGRPETLPTAPADVLRARGVDAGTAAWRLVRRHVRLVR